MIVKEHISFERGLDPLDSLNIGNPDIRKFKEILNYFQNVINKGFYDPNLKFIDIISKMNEFKDIVKLSVIENIKREFPAWKKDPDKWCYIINNFEIKFWQSDGGTTIYFQLNSLNPNISEVAPGSTSIEGLNKKLRKLIKTYQIPV